MHRTLSRTAAVMGLSVLIAGTAAAQGRARSANSYPPGFRPPPGMCRVWIQGVAPGQQPGVTDCASARAMASSNSSVLYGDRADDPRYRGRTGTYTRTVYDSYGNRVVQQVRRNADGSVSVLSSTPYGANGAVLGKRLPGSDNRGVYTNGKRDGEDGFKDHDNKEKNKHGNKHGKDHGNSDDNDHR